MRCTIMESWWLYLRNDIVRNNSQIIYFTCNTRQSNPPTHSTSWQIISGSYPTGQTHPLSSHLSFTHQFAAEVARSMPCLSALKTWINKVGWVIQKHPTQLFCKLSILRMLSAGWQNLQNTSWIYINVVLICKIFFNKYVDMFINMHIASQQ